MDSDENRKGNSKEPGKPDLSKALSIIPPAASLKESGGKQREKRVKISYDQDVGEDAAKVSKKLADELGISSKIEIVVAGKKKFVMKAIIDETIDEMNKVYVNPDIMRDEGVSDNSIATIRPSTSSGA
ncbi:MAG: hypothetical protein G5Z42_03220 [Caldisphaeraceae archaeon]|nr:hypothetical protein [Caldisphaeraceae archaeon]MEB3691761.1 hypothetical protein [Caldisphaeraceae archaeon]MEB3797818.1 hypothetical protein [Caldisphaeraceae archaeon]